MDNNSNIENGQPESILQTFSAENNQQSWKPIIGLKMSGKQFSLQISVIMVLSIDKGDDKSDKVDGVNSEKEILDACSRCVNGANRIVEWLNNNLKK